MQGLALLALLLSEHNSFHWEMSCAEWNQNRIEIMSDHHLTADAKGVSYRLLQSESTR